MSHRAIPQKITIPMMGTVAKPINFYDRTEARVSSPNKKPKTEQTAFTVRIMHVYTYTHNRARFETLINSVCHLSRPDDRWYLGIFKRSFFLPFSQLFWMTNDPPKWVEGLPSVTVLPFRERAVANLHFRPVKKSNPLTNRSFGCVLKQLLSYAFPWLIYKIHPTMGLRVFEIRNGR